MQATRRECEFTETEWEAVQQVVGQIRRFPSGCVEVAWETRRDERAIRTHDISRRPLTGRVRVAPG